MTVNPKISIITVVRNGKSHIEETINSVLNQSYQNVEYIIIDGNSTDGTIEIIEKYSNRLAYWISERDTGIYDAMNKGVKASSGDWLLFINADDSIVHDRVIEEVVPFLNRANTLIAYGQIRFIFSEENDKLYGEEWNLVKNKFRHIANCIPHQATFHHKSLFENELFDSSFQIAGDYDFLLRHLKNNEATFIPILVAKMRADGISFSASKIKLLKDTRKAQLKNKMYVWLPSIPWIASAAKLLVVQFIIQCFGVSGKDLLKKVIPLGR